MPSCQSRAELKVRGCARNYRQNRLCLDLIAMSVVREDERRCRSFEFSLGEPQLNESNFSLPCGYVVGPTNVVVAFVAMCSCFLGISSSRVNRVLILSLGCVVIVRQSRVCVCSDRCHLLRNRVGFRKVVHSSNVAQLIVVTILYFARKFIESTG